MPYTCSYFHKKALGGIDHEPLLVGLCDRRHHAKVALKLNTATAIFVFAWFGGI